MGAKLIIRVHPDDRVEVRVEGLTRQDTPQKAEQKLCRRITRRLEEDLGLVERREYEGAVDHSVTISEEEGQRLGGA